MPAKRKNASAAKAAGASDDDDDDGAADSAPRAAPATRKSSAAKTAAAAAADGWGSSDASEWSGNGSGGTTMQAPAGASAAASSASGSAGVRACRGDTAVGCDCTISQLVLLKAGLAVCIQCKHTVSCHDDPLTATAVAPMNPMHGRAYQLVDAGQPDAEPVLLYAGSVAELRAAAAKALQTDSKTVQLSCVVPLPFAAKVHVLKDDPSDSALAALSRDAIVYSIKGDDRKRGSPQRKALLEQMVKVALARNDVGGGTKAGSRSGRSSDSDRLRRKTEAADALFKFSARDPSDASKARCMFCGESFVAGLPVGKRAIFQAHIFPIGPAELYGLDPPPGMPYDINALSNLLALCGNCHAQKANGCVWVNTHDSPDPARWTIATAEAASEQMRRYNKGKFFYSPDSVACLPTLHRLEWLREWAEKRRTVERVATRKAAAKAKPNADATCRGHRNACRVGQPCSCRSADRLCKGNCTCDCRSHDCKSRKRSRQTKSVARMPDDAGDADDADKADDEVVPTPPKKKTKTAK